MKQSSVLHTCPGPGLTRGAFVELLLAIPNTNADDGGPENTNVLVINTHELEGFTVKLVIGFKPLGKLAVGLNAKEGFAQALITTGTLFGL